MSNHISHASLPYPIKHARFTLLIPYLDADGDPTDPTTPDTEVSQDGGSFADATEEMSTITGSNGMGYITLTGAETNNSAVGVACKVASGPKNTLATLYPRELPILANGTASAGASGSITLASSITYDITGCFVRTTGGTGGGGTGGANNQARRITAYNTSTQVATILPAWETTPDSTTTYDVLCPEGVTIGMLKALNPATAGRTLVVDASGLADANTVKVGPTGSGTAQTARDLGASVLLSVGTGTGQVNLSSGKVPATLASTDVTGNVAADLQTIKTQTVTCSGGVTVPAATLASTTNITAATGITVSTNNDKTGYGLSSAAVQAIWDALTSALTTVGSIGKLLVDNINATISSRLASSSYTAPLDAAGTRSAVGLGSANLDTQLSGIQADLPQRITKNTALAGFVFLMVDSSDHVTPKTGLTVTATRSLDGAAFGSCANSVSEISNGFYKIDLAAADLNGNVVALKFTATGADQRSITIVTEPT